MNITIVGDGSWGNALFHVLSQNTRQVKIARRGEPIINPEVVLLCVPAQSLRDVLRIVENPTIVVNAAKGIEQQSHKLPYALVKEISGGNVEYYSLIGPSFASEVMRDMPTLVNLGYERVTDSTKTLRDVFETGMFRVRLTQGVEALELSGAMKNVYAIVCGLAHGLGYEANTRVKLIVLAIEETRRLLAALRYSFDVDATAGIIGDLVLTCNSEESRNFRFGSQLATLGKEEAHRMLSGTVEGYHTLGSVRHLEALSGVKLRLARFTEVVVEAEQGSVKGLFEAFVKES